MIDIGIFNVSWSNHLALYAFLVFFKFNLIEFIFELPVSQMITPSIKNIRRWIETYSY